MQKYNLPLGLFRDSDASDKHQEVEDQAQRLKERVNPVRKRKQKNAKHELDVLFAEREVSLAEGEAPYIFPSNTLRTSTVSICLYVVRFLICNSFVILFFFGQISLVFRSS